MKIIHYAKSSVAVLVSVGCLGLLPLSTANAQQAGSTDQAAIEKALRKLDEEWSAAASAKRRRQNGFVLFERRRRAPAEFAACDYADGNSRAVEKGHRQHDCSGGWRPTRVEVAKSGDMAYVSGTYTFNVKDAGGKTMKDRGKYLEVWKRQADGSWKCSADAWNSDLPAAP